MQPKKFDVVEGCPERFPPGLPESVREIDIKISQSESCHVKGHMKQPRHGICSTQCSTLQPSVGETMVDLPLVPPPEWVPLPDDFALPREFGPNIIVDDDESIANVFVLALLQINDRGWCTMTSPVIILSFRSIVACVSLFIL